MTRRTARIHHDEVARMIKAVNACGLTVGRVVFDGETISVVIGGEGIGASTNKIDSDLKPETVQSLDEYKTWRDRERARGS